MIRHYLLWVGNFAAESLRFPNFGEYDRSVKQQILALHEFTMSWRAKNNSSATHSCLIYFGESLGKNPS